jgi:Protein kinase domain
VAVHEAGVVHRDLKPSNILLSPKGPRIIDFGIAWATGASTLTHVGTAVGSPGFLAPEQVRGATVTPATDVFALGATLAYAATADSPFGHGSSEVMLYRVVHEEPQLRGVPDTLAPLLRACLAKDPDERPSTLQLSMRLKEIAAREAQGISDPRPPSPRERPAQDVPTGRMTERYTPRPERPERVEHAERQGRVDHRTGRGQGHGQDTGRGPGHPSQGHQPAQGHHPSQARAAGAAGRPVQGRAADRAPHDRPAQGQAQAQPPRSTGGAPRPPAQRNGGQAQATGSGRTGAGPRRGGGTQGRRGPANPRLLRQRLIVFVLVTLVVALGIWGLQQL